LREPTTLFDLARLKSYTNYRLIGRSVLKLKGKKHMALTKVQKDEIVAEVTDLLTSSKMTVICEYQGMSVAQAQELRRSAIENGSNVKVVKNRLLRHAAKQIEALNTLDLSGHAGQLMYIFNPEDEVAAAKLAAEFSKKNPELVLKAAFSNEGVLDR
jgi:large subunit ribosomal protein L10